MPGPVVDWPAFVNPGENQFGGRDGVRYGAGAVGRVNAMGFRRVNTREFWRASQIRGVLQLPR